MSGRIDLRSKILLILVVVISVFIPVQFWRGVWFGADLTDEEIRAALTDTESPRRLQHALSRLEARIRADDPAVQTWYPSVAKLADHPLEEIRLEAAWVMGQDNQSALFHDTLRVLLADQAPIVRRNAALALTRFADPAALPVLREMLQPATVSAPASGPVGFQVAAGALVERGALLAHVGGWPVAAPLSGRVLALAAPADQTVQEGAPLLRLAPDPEHVWEALRALVLLGGPEDLPPVREVLSDPRYSEAVREQARLTARAIESRR